MAKLKGVDYDGISKYIMDAKSEMQSAESKNGVTIILVGSSGAGKSHFMKNVFFDRIYSNCNKSPKDFDFWIRLLFTESPYSNALKDLINDKEGTAVFKMGFDLDMINYVINMNYIYEKEYNFFLAFDDCIKLRYIDIIEKLICIHRNINVSSLISLQWPKMIPLACRTSVYFQFFFNFNSEDGIKIVIDDFLSMYIPGKNRIEKMKYYKKWCSDYGFFMIDNLNHKVFQVNKKYLMEELFAHIDGESV